MIIGNVTKMANTTLLYFAASFGFLLLSASFVMLSGATANAAAPTHCYVLDFDNGEAGVIYEHPCDSAFEQAFNKTNHFDDDYNNSTHGCADIQYSTSWAAPFGSSTRICDGPFLDAYRVVQRGSITNYTYAGAASDGSDSGSGGSGAGGSGTGRSGGCTSHFLTFPAWYDGLIDESTCQITSPATLGLSQFIFRIVLNIIDIVLQIIAYCTAGYIIYGGFKYLTSAGDSSRIVAGRKIITNALIGLVISFMSIGIVNLVSSKIGITGALASCSNPSSTQLDPNCVGVNTLEATNVVNGVLNTAYFAAGITGVIVIIISAFFYVTSNGDSSKTKRAKDGILYAVVGLVVVMVAFIITNFVVGKF